MHSNYFPPLQHHTSPLPHEKCAIAGQLPPASNMNPSAENRTVKPARNHPRRPPAHKSVSLRHSPPAPPRPRPSMVNRQQSTVSSPNLASDKANPPSTVSPNVAIKKNSSGESSDAGQWFENSNINAHQSSAGFMDNDPPFFLRNSSSSETPPDGRDPSDPNASAVIPYRSGILHLGTDGSSNEDFRSVIDDLTIANKKLKQKLKKYERLYDAHLQEEKLFEVRFHGLPDHKKRELEETLRKFAADLDDGASSSRAQTSAYAPLLEQHVTHSSVSRFAESGYASASGQISSAPSNQTSNQGSDRRKFSKSAYNRQQQNVHSYLHDIPTGLLPTNNASMTEKSRKKLVVRRLEQVFAGKRSAPGNHQQPIQQEEVAQSAATADRVAREATGKSSRPEGKREARIMPDGNPEILPLQGEVLQKLRPGLHVDEHDFAGSGSPDQRPTRPLDLDPHRAQYPMENMDYFRHLGFTPPDMTSGEVPLDGHGWLYLNLLINMAQLHTLNVTPEFVKDALTEYSNQLELSHDGRKVRWKGGLGVSRFNSDGSSEWDSGNSPPDRTPDGESPSKRMKTDASGISSENTNFGQRSRGTTQKKQPAKQDKFNYVPLFFHKEDSEDESSYGFDLDSTEQSAFLHNPTAGDSSGRDSSAVRNASPKRKREDGPMIFYKAKFCTDLSGDRLGASLAHPGSYKVLSDQALGAGLHSRPNLHRVSSVAECRGPLDAAVPDQDTISVTRTASSEEGFSFSPDALMTGVTSDNSEAVDFEVSGLGGVQPEDNFAIRVRRSQVPTAYKGPNGHRNSRLYPKRITDLLSEKQSSANNLSTTSDGPQAIKEEIISAAQTSLPSSTLPPASFLPFDSASSGDVDSDLESDVSSAPDSDSGEDASTALRLRNISTQSGLPQRSSILIDEEEESSDDTDESDDGSIDLLATARALDPNTIRRSEREYDAAIADRLAEDIKPGSSAATAGGGSGFNSPASIAAAVLRREKSARTKEHSVASGSASSGARKLKRSQTKDSTGTLLRKGSKSQKMTT